MWATEPRRGSVKPESTPSPDRTRWRVRSPPAPPRHREHQALQPTPVRRTPRSSSARAQAVDARQPNRSVSQPLRGTCIRELQAHGLLAFEWMRVPHLFPHRNPMAIQLPLGDLPIWIRVKRDHPAARALADRHYSRQTPGAREFLPPGETLVLVTPCGRAVWGVCRNLDNGGTRRLRCAIFRNEGAGLSSNLVWEATQATNARWPGVLLTTEINTAKVRPKKPFGLCFRAAGWTDHGWTTRGLLVLRAP